MRQAVEAKLAGRGSPQQIAGWLTRAYPDDREPRVSHETIDMSLFVQPRGALRKELTRYLRSCRMVRRPRAARAANGQSRLRNAVNISARPAEELRHAGSRGLHKRVWPAYRQPSSRATNLRMLSMA